MLFILMKSPRDCLHTANAAAIKKFIEFFFFEGSLSEPMALFSSASLVEVGKYIHPLKMGLILRNVLKTKIKCR